MEKLEEARAKFSPIEAKIIAYIRGFFDRSAPTLSLDPLFDLVNTHFQKQL